MHKLSPKSVELKPDLWQLLAGGSRGEKILVLVSRLMSKGVAEAPLLCFSYMLPKLAATGCLNQQRGSKCLRPVCVRGNYLDFRTIFRAWSMCFCRRREPQQGQLCCTIQTPRVGKAPARGQSAEAPGGIWRMHQPWNSLCRLGFPWGSCSMARSHGSVPSALGT